MIRSAERFIIDKMEACKGGEALRGHILEPIDRPLSPNYWAFDFICIREGCRLSVRYNRQKNELTILTYDKCKSSK
jgi:hypothetical protein